MSPNGRTLAAYKPHIPTTSEGSIEVWHLDKNRINTPVTLGGSLGARAIAFSDDNTLFGVGTMGSGLEWNLRPAGPLRTDLGSLVRRACEIAGRGLTGAEVNRYYAGAKHGALPCAIN